MKKEIVNYINLWIASFKRGRQFITHDIWRIGLPGEVVPNGLIIKQIRAVILLARGLVEETLLLRASALTFATLLFLVPFLAMMFFFIQTFNLGDQVYDRMDDQLFKAVTALRNRDIEGEEEREKGEGEAQDEALIDEGEAGGPVVAPSDEAATPYLGAAIPESGDKDEVLKQQMIGLVFPILAEGHSITDDPQYTNPVKIFVGLAEEAGKSAHTVGISGLVYVLIAVFGFMRNVEYTLNRIWGVKRQRNLLLVISHYLMITFLLPFVAASILGISAALESQYIVDIMGPFTLLARGVQFLMLWMSFTLVYQFVPNTKVQLRYALLGGFVGGTLYMLNSWAYLKFQIGLANYTSFFSAFALFPLLLFYIYISWLVFLFGSLVSFAYQNEKTFAMEQLSENAPLAYREALAVRLMIELARRYNKALYPLEVKEAAENWNVPTRLLSDTLDVLVQAKLVVACIGNPVTYQPARASNRIRVLDVVNAVREDGQDPSMLRSNTRYQLVYAGLDAADPEIMQADIESLSKQVPEIVDK